MKAKMEKLGKLMSSEKYEAAISCLDEAVAMVHGEGEDERLQRGLLMRDKGRMLLKLEKESEGVQCLEHSAQLLRELTNSNNARVKQTSLLHLGDLEVSLAVRQEDDDDAKIAGMKRAIACAQASCFLLTDAKQRKIQLAAVMHKQNVLISMLVPLENFRDATNVAMQMSFLMLKEKNTKELGINLVRLAALWEQQSLLEESEFYLTLAAHALKHAKGTTEGQVAAAKIYLDDFRERYPDKHASNLEERSKDVPDLYSRIKLYCSKAGLVYWSDVTNVFTTNEGQVFSCPLDEIHKADQQLAGLAKKNGVLWLYCDEEEPPEALMTLIHKHQVSIWHCTAAFRLEQQ